MFSRFSRFSMWLSTLKMRSGGAWLASPFWKGWLAHGLHQSIFPTPSVERCTTSSLVIGSVKNKRLGKRRWIAPLFSKKVVYCKFNNFGRACRTGSIFEGKVGEVNPDIPRGSTTPTSGPQIKNIKSQMLFLPISFDPWSDWSPNRVNIWVELWPTLYC